jgi:hypothetical protein
MKVSVVSVAGQFEATHSGEPAIALGSQVAWLQYLERRWTLGITTSLGPRGVCREKLIAIELKSWRGQCSRPQRFVHDALMRAGGSGGCAPQQNAAMWALRKSGVKFRTVAQRQRRARALAIAQAASAGGAEAQSA